MSKPIHPLRRWLFENQESPAAFSRRTDITPGYLSLLLAWKRRPSLRMIDRITAATNGAITANDFQPLTAPETA